MSARGLVLAFGAGLATVVAVYYAGAMVALAVVAQFLEMLAVAA